LVAEDMLATYNILDHIPLGACILREDYVVLFWNSTLELWTHIPRDQIIGTDIRQSYPLLQEAKFKIRLESIFQGGPPAIFSSLLHRHVIPSTLRDGSPRIQHTTVTCLPTAEGGGFHALLSMEDVTDPTRRMQEHREMRDQALQEVEQRKKAVRVKDEFVSMVSHELRTPLTSITGSLRLLIGGVVPLESPQAWAMIDIANRNAERLLRLINDILDIQKRIFQKFAQSTAPGSRQKEGTGLGLNISQQIIELHDGQIGFETQQGEGTTFYFNLSVWNANAPS